MMLTSIRLKFGSAPDDAPPEFTPGPMTVFIGPDPAGPRLALAELTRSFETARNDFFETSPEWKIVADIEPGLPPPGELRERLLAAIKADLAPLRTVNAAESAVLNTLVKILRDPDVEPETLEEAGSWLKASGKRGQLEALIKAGKLYPTAEPSPASPPEKATLDLIHAVVERSDEYLIVEGIIDLHGYYQLYSGQCLVLDASTDPGTLGEHIAEHIRFIVIDEPGASLTPALAHQLGLELATLAAERGACVFAANPGPEFLQGCIDAGQDVDIIRLDDHNGHPSAQLLPRDNLPPRLH